MTRLFRARWRFVVLLPGVLLTGCGSDVYTPPRIHNDQRTELEIRAFAGSDWDSVGFLGTGESCQSRGWNCTLPGHDGPAPHHRVMIWSDGEPTAQTYVGLPTADVALDPSITGIVRRSQHLCYIDGPEPQVTLYAC